MLKLPRKNFYDNHLQEISKYLQENIVALHIISKSSSIISQIPGTEQLIINEENSSEIVNLEDSAKKYDLIVVTDIFEVSHDIYGFVKSLKKNLKEDGKVLLTSVNPKWNTIFKIFEFMKLKRSSNINSFIHPKKISNVFDSIGFENIRNYNRQIFPFKFFGLGSFVNIIFELTLGVFNLGIKTYFIYQLKERQKLSYTKSIIVPAKNEEGNLEELISRIPSFDNFYEVIISCGPSKDNTYQKAIELKNKFSNLNINVFEQTKNGKANAVWEAIEKSTGDVLAILDSDISVDPEELTNFFEIIETRNCDFVNGTRLMYKMEDRAMRSLNKIGNRTFQYLISKLIDVNLSDTLCGTKIFKKANIQNLHRWQNKTKISDPFCDFDLIFSYAYSGGKILEHPVHYRSRKYGNTNISRFRDGWRLILYLINSLLLFKTSY
tara:strand:- start:5517 stop:6824 length:1308 start_codon:yes stop_codon:yes gene_type:complete